MNKMSVPWSIEFAGSYHEQGYVDGHGTTAKFSKNTSGIAIDSNGDLYIADTDNHCIRKITPDQYVFTVVGSPAREGYLDGSRKVAQLYNPTAIAISNNTIYFATEIEYDKGYFIRKLSDSDQVITLAGSIFEESEESEESEDYTPKDGKGSEASFKYIESMWINRDPDGNEILMVLDYNSILRTVTSDGTVTTVGFAGDDTRDHYTAIDRMGNKYYNSVSCITREDIYGRCYTFGKKSEKFRIEYDEYDTELYPKSTGSIDEVGFTDDLVDCKFDLIRNRLYVLDTTCIRAICFDDKFKFNDLVVSAASITAASKAKKAAAEVATAVSLDVLTKMIAKYKTLAKNANAAAEASLAVPAMASALKLFTDATRNLSTAASKVKSATAILSTAITTTEMDIAMTEKVIAAAAAAAAALTH